MKLHIDWSQPSTLRGLIWLITGLVGFVGVWMGKDASQILLVGSAVAGGLGVALKD